jgi:TonB family protein
MRKWLFILMLSVGTCCYGQQPQFKGGQAALYDFISQKIVYPEYSRRNCISGTIKVSFMIDKTGSVYNARISQGLGLDLDDEALRVVQLTSGKWIIPVKYEPVTIVIPIRFEADRTACGYRNATAINAAIIAYNNEQNLEDAVTSYYAAKYSGKVDTTHEAAIISLKRQLGYDDNFINDVLEQAKEKLNQGDKKAACHDWNFIRNIGSDKADKFIAQYCQ